MNLEINQRLKELLINYVSVAYEENAVYTDESLMNEYEFLRKNNQLIDLFEAEQPDYYFN